jgi:hypothetical protein
MERDRLSSSWPRLDVDLPLPLASASACARRTQSAAGAEALLPVWLAMAGGAPTLHLLPVTASPACHGEAVWNLPDQGRSADIKRGSIKAVDIREMTNKRIAWLLKDIVEEYLVEILRSHSTMCRKLNCAQVKAAVVVYNAVEALLASICAAFHFLSPNLLFGLARAAAPIPSRPSRPAQPALPAHFCPSAVGRAAAAVEAAAPRAPSRGQWSSAAPHQRQPHSVTHFRAARIAPPPAATRSPTWQTSRTRRPRYVTATPRIALLARPRDEWGLKATARCDPIMQQTFTVTAVRLIQAINSGRFKA